MTALGKAPPTKGPGVDYEGRIRQMNHFRAAILEADKFLDKTIYGPPKEWQMRMEWLRDWLRISAGEVED